MHSTSVSSPRRRRTGFTLVELLVVIGIIALLISILLPSLSKARKAAQNVQCLANLRSFGQQMFIYASQSKGAILGAGINTGAAYFYPRTANSWPTNAYTDGTDAVQGMPIHPSDYFQPILSMNFRSWATRNSDSFQARYAEYMSLKQFVCPVFAGVLAGPYGGTGQTLQSISYCTAWGNLLETGTTTAVPVAGVTSATRISTGTTWPVYPPGYTPKLNKVGTGSNKIFAADGAKYSNSTTPVDYNITQSSTFGTTSVGSTSNYSDFGPWSTVSCAYDRTKNPNNSALATAGGIDTRILSYRHGGSNNGQFRMNAVFFDGHCESMDELQSANPAYWLPKGTSLPSGALAKVYPDVVNRYGVTATYTVP